jgi:WD40 repeat protein
MTEFATPNARVLLIGTRHYASHGLADIEAVHSTLESVKETLKLRWGLPEEQIELLEDPADVVRTNRRIRAVARTEGPVLFYFVGHAVLEERSADLYLALSGTDLKELDATALKYSTIAAEVRDHRRNQFTAILLDGCYTGRALSEPGRAADVGFARSNIRGAYVIASSADDIASWADGDGPFFSRAFVDLLRDGDPDCRAMLTLDEIYLGLRRRLRDRGAPEPQQHSVNAVGHLFLAPNAGYPVPPVDLPKSGEPAPGWNTSHCPYVGLRSYEADERQLFFGRRRTGPDGGGGEGIVTTEDLVDAVQDLVSVSGPHLFSGPSGVGKSSLMCAGLLPAIGEGALGIEGSADWPQYTMVPGPDPMTELAKLCRAQLEGDGTRVATAEVRGRLVASPRAAAELVTRRAADGEPARPPVVVVDQAEELFGSDVPAADRAAFLAALAAMSQVPPGASQPAAVVLLVLSADHLGECMEHPVLRRRLDDLIIIEPVTTTALRDIIVEPARIAGIGIGEGLIAAVTADAEASTALGRTGTVDVGALPHLSNALYLTWHGTKPGMPGASPDGHVMTVEVYSAIGGIRGALGRSASSTYEALPADLRLMARRLLLDLVGIHETTSGTTLARRRVRRTALERPGDPPGALDQVIETFADQRLLTLGGDTDGGTVEIAHEALIESWTGLREWVDKDREWIEFHDRLDHDADRWFHDGAGLYGGRRLGAVEDDLAELRRKVDELQPRTRRFLAASRRRRTAFRAATATVAAFLVGLATTSTGLYLVNRHRSAEATSKALAAAATQVTAKDPALGRLLAVAADRYGPTADSLGSILASQAAPDVTRLADHPEQSFSSASTLDGRFLATAGAEGHVRLWDMSDARNPRLRADLPVPGGGAIFRVALSRDGSLLAAGDEAGHTLLWRLGSGTPQVQRLPSGPPTGPVYALAFDETGRRLATGTLGGALAIFTVGGGAGGSSDAAAAPVVHNIRTEVEALAFQPGGGNLVVADGTGAVSRWRVDDQHLTSLGTIKRFTLVSQAVAVSPDGRLLAAASNDHHINLWTVDPASGRLSQSRSLIGSADAVYALSFSRDGKTLVSAANDGKATLWSTSDGRPELILPQAMPLHGAEFLADGSSVATVGQDGILRVWHLPGRDVIAEPDKPVTSTFAADGRMAVTGGLDGVVSIWTVGPNGDVTRAATLPKKFGPVHNMALSPTRPVLAIPSEAGRVELWDVSRPAHPAFITSLPGARPEILGVTFSPDGNLIAAFGQDDPAPQGGLAGSVRLWDVSSTAGPKLIAEKQDRRGAALTASFSADGHILAVGGGDSRVNLYEVGAAGLTLAGHVESEAQYVIAVRFAPRGRVLAFAGEKGRVRLADVTRADHPVVRPGVLSTFGSELLSVAWLGNDRILGADSDGTTWLWRPGTAIALARLTTHDGAAYSVDADQSGRSFATAGLDGHLQVLAADSDRVIARICDDAGLPMTGDEWRRFEPDVVQPTVCN